MDIGNLLNKRVRDSIAALLQQGELMQLTYNALNSLVKSVNGSNLAEFEIHYPVGFSADKRELIGTRKYTKDQILSAYQYLIDTQLATNGIYQLVILVEALLSDTIRLLVQKYPEKLGRNRSISTEIILSSTSLKEIHLHAADSVVHEMSYSSPQSFAEEAKKFISVNLLECPAFHKYIELKATRDVLIHNQGIANHLYISKCGSHARVESGQKVPVNIVYFLESYEQCIKVCEWLEQQLHAKWHSSEFEQRQNAQQKNTNA